MNFREEKGDGFVPSYTRTDLTDALHEEFGMPGMRSPPY